MSIVIDYFLFIQLISFKTLKRIIKTSAAVADPDLEIRGGGVGGGGHPDPGISGGPGVQKNFFRPFGPSLIWSKNKGRGWGALGPSPGSGTEQ